MLSARSTCFCLAFALVLGLSISCDKVRLPGTTPPPATQDAKADIVAGVHLSLTGAGAEEALAYRQGLEAQINDINAKGGIGGAKIRLRVEDDGGQPQKAIAAAHRLVEEDKADLLLGSTSTPTTMAVLPYVTEKGVPLLFPMVPLSAIYDPPRQTVFSLLPNFDRLTRLAVSYMLDTIKPKKVGLLWAEADEGKQAAISVRSSLSSKRILTSVDVPIQSGTVSDFTSVVQMLRKSQPDALVAVIPATDAVGLAHAKKRLGWDVPVFGHLALAESRLLAAGADADGLFGVSPMATASDQYLADVSSIVNASFPQATVSSPTVYGIGVARLLQKVIGASSDAHRFTSIVAAAESLNNVDVKVFPPVTFGANRRLGLDKLAITQVRQGQIVRVSGWLPLPPPN